MAFAFPSYRQIYEMKHPLNRSACLCAGGEPRLQRLCLKAQNLDEASGISPPPAQTLHAPSSLHCTHLHVMRAYILLAATVAVALSASCPNIPTVDTVELAQYTGRW